MFNSAAYFHLSTVDCHMKLPVSPAFTLKEVTSEMFFNSMAKCLDQKAFNFSPIDISKSSDIISSAINKDKHYLFHI